MDKGKREFLVNLRNAAGFLFPTVQTPGNRRVADEFTRRMQAATLWLTPKAVEGFDISAFDSEELPDAKRVEIEKAVEDFLGVAREVPADQPATAEQYEQALGSFLSILELMKPFLDNFRIHHLFRRALMKKEFPEYVQYFVVRVGFDSTDDPAAWIYVVVSDNEVKRAIGEFNSIRDHVHDMFQRERIDLYPYLALRTISEQNELEQGVPARRVR